MNFRRLPGSLGMAIYDTYYAIQAAASGTAQGFEPLHRTSDSPQNLCLGDSTGRVTVKKSQGQLLTPKYLMHSSEGNASGSVVLIHESLSMAVPQYSNRVSCRRIAMKSLV
jgi:hypothetical protein